MSGRLMKKVLKEQEEKHQHQQEEDLYSGGDDSESSRASPLSSSVNPFDLLNDQDQVHRGFPLMEVFNIIYLSRDEVKPEEQHGTITLICENEFQDLYNVSDLDTAGKTSIKYKDDIPVMAKGPSSFRDAILKYDLFFGAFKGTIELSWDHYMLHLAPVFFEERRIQSRDGTGSIAILMGQFANATVATLEVKLLNNSAATKVYGAVGARNSLSDRANCTSVLFVKKDDYGIQVGPDGVIPLSKSVVGVPLSSVLYVDISLHVNGHHCTGTVTFDADIVGEYEGYDSNDDPMVQVKVKWNCNYYRQSGS